MKKIRRMTCTCCGNGCMGRQWWNQDNGYTFGEQLFDNKVIDPNHVLRVTWDYDGYASCITVYKSWSDADQHDLDLVNSTLAM